MIIYFLFSSITFLQLYIPLVIELRKISKKHTPYFIVRSNYKDYANPFSETNYPILLKYAKKYNIILIDSRKINIKSIQGLVFMVDGDIYGPPVPLAFRDTLLYKLDFTKTKRISITEHMNYRWGYQHYIKYVDYVILPNQQSLNQIELSEENKNLVKNNLHKNLFLGNTKFDNIPNIETIYKKYKLSDKQKYCLLLFPKIQFRKDYKAKELSNIYQILHILDYKIIVKTRPKDNTYPYKIDPQFYGDKFIVSDIYPNESLELMKVCSLCIMFSSSAGDETIYSKIPTLDFPVIWKKMGKIERNEYLVDEKVFRRIEKWRDLDKDKLKQIINEMESKGSNYFDNIISKNFNNLGNSSKVFLDYFL